MSMPPPSYWIAGDQGLFCLSARTEMAMSRLDTTAERYDPTTVWLHWITVALVVALWVIGQTGDLVPRGPLRTGMWSTHVVLGFLTAFALMTRVAWRAH